MPALVLFCTSVSSAPSSPTPGDLALAVDGVFDHRRVSAARIVAEARSWGLIREHRAESIVGETLEAFGQAVDHVEPPKGVSPGRPSAYSGTFDGSSLV